MVLRRLALALLVLLPPPFGCGGGRTGDVLAPITSGTAPAATPGTQARPTAHGSPPLPWRLTPP